MSFKRLADDGTRTAWALAFLDLKVLRRLRREQPLLAVIEAKRIMGID